MIPELQVTTAAIESSFSLLDLSRRARSAATLRELGFVLVNDSRALVPYRQAGLWIASEGLYTLSGVVQIEANAPYAQWLDKVCAHLAASGARESRALVRSVMAMDLPEPLAAEWQDWWPLHAVWLPLPAASSRAAPAPGVSASSPPALDGAGLILVRELPWSAQDIALLQEWADVAAHALNSLHRPSVGSWRTLRRKLASQVMAQPDRKWWAQPRVRWLALVVVVLAFPVRLTVLAPGELVPSNPLVIRAPLDGVVDTFHVQPNQTVKKDQPLFGFDEALIQSRAEVATQALSSAETEYRQTSQQALTDGKSKQMLALLIGKIEEKRAEVDYLREQLQRARVLAPQDGVAMFDDPSEWIGRPVSVGERIMRIASPADSEVEAWVPIADAIELPPQAKVSLHLNASPLSPVVAQLRFQAYDAVQRPDGSYAYRVRATLNEPTAHRVGLKGTAKLHGGWVPLVYWVLRRPLAAVRSTLGF
ncbi:MAG: HlyD family efflux transporter periplasmic adaptor subunit [Pseudomonadota bacterium]